MLIQYWMIISSIVARRTMASTLRRTSSRFGEMHPSVPDRGRADHVGVPLCHPGCGAALRVPVLDGDGHARAIEKLAPGNAARHLRGVFFLQASIVRALKIVKQLTGFQPGHLVDGDSLALTSVAG
ncbi:hypothetical protein [Paraburkholderia sp. BR10882]|uniref:hypothetical protein n=1 Tax=unclassified Paraburkholderia TaxID=2615204 RepID=UPI0034CD378F